MLRPVVRRFVNRTARTTPLASSQRRLELIKIVIDAEHTHLSTRIAALILLLYGIPVRRISELTLDDVKTTPEQTTIRIGTLPAPIPEPLLPYFHQHPADRGNLQTMNHHNQWLFPAPAPGTTSLNKHSCMRLRGLGIDIHAARNAALHDLTKEIDPASLPGRPSRLHTQDHEHPRRARSSAHGHLPRPQ